MAVPVRIPNQERVAEPSTLDLLSSVGEVAYRWTLDDDALRWDGDTNAVLGIAADRLGTGRAFAAFHDPGNVSSRRDAVVGSQLADRGAGISFHVEYGLRPSGADGPTIWVEDFGRWFGDGGQRPARAVGILRVINDRYERDRRLAYRSYHDQLTGTFNRIHLLECLQEVLDNAKRLRTPAALLVVAVDNFRLLNDTYGFDVADQVLAVVAKRVKTQLRGGDSLGRIGGNKLGAILNDCDDSALAFAAQRFLSCVRDEVVTTDRGVIVASVSIGAVALPRHAQTVGEATSRAEESLAAARAHGYGRFVAYVHTPGRDEARSANSSLSTSLIQALREQRMRLAFQPIVDINTRKPVFHEALLRLDGPDGAIIPAASFMPLSERLGLSRLLDQRALDLAIAALRDVPSARLSVNVTPDTAADPAWLARLSSALRHNPGIATRLTVEITETTAIRDLEDAARFVAAVKGLGCQVALDDFGAGYTSFRTLRQLEIDLVKIDGDYVKNLPSSADDQLFVRTLADLARNFGLKTVAEWVRDEETVALLKGYGIDYIQGELTGDAIATLPSETSPAGNAG